ncbi:gastrokine-3-like [Anomaloglossus baeobatrachus]|uniref:gastrokine-3-like n=1 Tax=Anomaloglossus baeobatrachus TaxID=238106 RepID=UPI003F5027D9
MGAVFLLLGFLAFFINPLHGDEAFQYLGTGYNGENEYHTVNINEQVKVVVFNVYSGRQSANAVFDYSQNIVAYHMPYKGICILAHMDIATFPGLGRINEWIHTKREQKKDLEELRKHYFVSNEQVYDLAQYGNAVQSLCWEVPTYWAREDSSPKAGFGAGGCARIHLFCLHIGLCGGFHL